VLEVHVSPVGYKFWYRLGSLHQATINWGPSRHFGAGTTPRVALNGHDFAIEVHKNQLGFSLYCSYGSIGGGTDDEVRWGQSLKYDNGITPAVAMNDAGLVVEVHETDARFSHALWYNLAAVKGSGANRRVDWIKGAKDTYDSGVTPAVAVNNRGIIVAVHKAYGNPWMWWQVFRVEGNKLKRYYKKQFAAGRNPSVAITDDGLIIVTANTPNGSLLRQFTAQLNDKLEIVGPNAVKYYDDGTTSSVAVAGPMAVEVHEGKILQTLWSSTSLITDRTTWMHDRLDTLGKKTLRDLVLPASHDAAMYKGGFSAFGKTQEMTIYEQLRYGIRYFDLRPWWYWLPKHHWVIGHGDIIGPSVQTVLNDVAKFAKDETRKELVILKLSHFRNTDAGSFDILRKMIESTIGPWLVKSTPGNKRLADVTLNEYVKGRKGPAVLVVVDEDWAVKPRTPGLWVYRDWYSKYPPTEGDLRVFDRFTGTEDARKMRDDQFKKFADYDGTMATDPSKPCDLFLLSWTLTPKYKPPWMVWPLAKDVNPDLGQYIRFGFPPPTIPNAKGKIMNLLYVDYVEFARVTDVALFQNGEPMTADEARPRKRARAPRSKNRPSGAWNEVVGLD
jgi:hypothetical protein